MIKGLVIRHYRDDDSIPEITRLLHQSYAALAQMGLRYTATYQDEEVTLRRLLRGVAFVAELDREIVATVTLYPESPLETLSEWYRKEGVHYFGQMAVRPDLQGKGIGTRLVSLMEEEARKLGATELALDTAVPALHLREWYRRLGYRQVEELHWGTTNYRSVILSKTL